MSTLILGKNVLFKLIHMEASKEEWVILKNIEVLE